jgi:aspartyl-tRNA(Asn)/glutamyl-tRNA(Gln) amidotransferase subunit C
MKIDVKHIAKLSRISLTDDELKKFTPQMESIFESVDVLKEIDTTNIEPMKRHVDLKDLRDDAPEIGLTQEEVLKNANFKEKGCVKVYGKIFGELQES